MLTQLALLSLAAVTVTGVTSATHDTDLTVDVATSEPIPADAVRPMSGHRLVYLFVYDTTPAREVFENGDHPVVARTRPRYTKLEVPVDPGVRCHEPATVEALASGLRVQFPCGSNAGVGVAVEEHETRAPGRRRETKLPVRGASQELLQAALTLPAEMPFAAKSEGEDDETPNPEAKPADEGKPRPDVEAVTPPVAKLAALAPEPALATAQPTAPSVHKGAAKAPEKAVPPDAPTAPSLAAAPARNASPSLATADTGRSWLVLAIVVMVGVVGGVLALTRRRRARRQSLIQILETAAIGPKRTLLVARVNGQIMVLGASEAGIALLAPLNAAIESPVAAVMGNPPALRGQPEDFPPAAVAEVAPEPDGEVGVLSRLFHIRPKASSARDADAFRELLDESYEDQELRDKLAQGLSGKVS
jgi:flagellar biogenesis protein FliO